MTLEPIERWNLSLCLGAVAASFALVTPAFAGSLALGAAIEAVNFRGLLRSARGLFSPETAGGRAWTGAFGFRFLFLGVSIGVALHFGADPIGLLVGLSLVIPASVFEAWRTRPPILPDAPALASDDDEWERWNPWLAREREAAEPGGEDAERHP